MTPPWLNPNASYGVRCVLLARSEMALGARANPYPGPNTSPGVARYLAPCVRDVDGDGDDELLGLTEGNWCAAFASWCARECLLPGESAPHKYRAGVVEIVADAKANGRWQAIKTVRDGAFAPSVGDLAIWDRSNPDKPATSWWRHVNRVTQFNPMTGRLTTIGGNEGRKITVTDAAPKSLTDSKLLGFVSYAQSGRPLDYAAAERAADQGLIAMFTEAHRRTAA